MEEYPLNQSAWRRGWNDTKTAWKSLPFILLDGVVCVLVGATFGWYWGLGLFVFALFSVLVGATASAPVKQRNEAREKLLKLQDTLGQLGWIEAVIIDGVDLLNKLKQKHYMDFSLCEQKELDNFGEWYEAVVGHFQKHMIGEYPSWYRFVFIGKDEPSVVEVIRAYEAGLDHLEDISKKLNSSNAHTGDYQN